MCVYVDPLTACLPNSNWKWRHSAHLFADTESELHAFAESLGLKRSWFQDGRPEFPHYDLSPGKHREAIKAGAMAVSREFVVGWVSERRASGDHLPLFRKKG